MGWGKCLWYNHQAEKAGLKPTYRGIHILVLKKRANIHLYREKTGRIYYPPKEWSSEWWDLETLFFILF